ncbi:hypothetical protein AB1Y20_007639 [Prymnesium parvum]|uniref:Uncharacterized protein n=1 Tax=Prymnesium parvum TaxID=97485 RepID=A0AB34IY96_PRYPA
MASAAGCFIGGDCAEAQRTIHAAAVTLSLAPSGWAGHHNYDLTVAVAACELERQLFVSISAEPTDIEIQSREGCTADLVRSPLTRALLPVLKLVETPGCSALLLSRRHAHASRCRLLPHLHSPPSHSHLSRPSL